MVLHPWIVQGATMAACGHMYLDGGDELEVATAADNLLAFDAATSPGSNGTQGQVRAGHCSCGIGYLM